MCKAPTPATESAKKEEEERTLTVVQPPPPISMMNSLKTGWKEEPAVQFYLREVLLGIIICMAQVPTKPRKKTACTRC